MFTSSLLALLPMLGAASAQVYQGFNYGSVFTDGSPITQTDYENRFSTAQELVGTSGFTSARLFTTIQGGTTNAPTQAIPAAITTKTSLLLGLFLNSDQAVFNNELTALRSAISTYGQDFIDLIAGISVGSEDLYRISPIGIENDSGAGVEPAQVADYIGQVRSIIAGTAASGKLVGHVDTWTAWVNSSNNAVIYACDFIGMDAYPYFQNTMSNAIDSGESLFFDAYNATVSVAGGKPVWITETGWPVSGPTENLAVASIENAQTYWDRVACRVFGQINTWWYILQDAYPTVPSPSFGVVGTTLSNTPLYDLSCDASTSASSSNIASRSSSASSDASTIRSSSLSSTSTVQSASAPSDTAATTGSPAVESGLPSVTSSKVTGSETNIGSTTPAAVSTPAVANTLSTVVKASSATSGESVAATDEPTASSPTSLSGAYQYPHLIVSVDKNSPEVAQGNGYNAHVSPTISTIFNFDIPPSYKGLTCSLVFLFPARESLQTSNYTVTGNGGLEIAQVETPATAETTFDTVPAVAADTGTIAVVQAGNSYLVASSACAAGARIGYQVSATGSLDLEYFQDYNPAPIGVYITAY